jgi:hypothetical protein
MADKLTYGDIPPKWFNVLTIVLVSIVFILAAWTIFSMFGCSNSNKMLDYVKFKNPECKVLKVTEKPCGTEVILQCPYYEEFKTICLTEHK